MTENVKEHGLNRRSFLKATAGVAAAGAVGAGIAAGPLKHLKADAAAASDDSEQTYKVTCSWSCSFCQYDITVRDGHVCNMKPQANFRYHTCLKGKSRIQMTYSDKRILYPMKRKTFSKDAYHPENRGTDEWERITWDEAAQLISSVWLEEAEKYGPRSNGMYTCSGSQGMLNGDAGMLQRFFNALDCTYWMYSFDAATSGGLSRGGVQWFEQSEPEDFVNSDYVFLWASNPVGAQIQMWQHLANAKEAGATLVAIDPNFSPSAMKADKWIRTIPGTDPALILGMENWFITNDKYDHDFVANHTNAAFIVRKDKDTTKDGMFVKMSDIGLTPKKGVDATTGAATTLDNPVVYDAAVKKYVSYDDAKDPQIKDVPAIGHGIQTKGTAFELATTNCAEYTFEKTHEITDISQEDFDFICNAMLPEHKCAHYINFGSGAYTNGAMTSFGLAGLLGLTGNFGEPGRSVGGFDFVFGSFTGNADAVPSNGKMMNSISILAACDIMDSGKFLGEDYPIKTIWITEGNLLSGNVNYNRLKAKLIDKLDMVVCQDIFWQESALMADVVLPAADVYEYEDVVPLSHEKDVRISEKCIDPMGEAKTDSQAVRFLADYFNVGKYVNDCSDEQWWKDIFDFPSAKQMGITMDTLRQKKQMRYVDEFPYIGNKGLQSFTSAYNRIMYYNETVTPRMPNDKAAAWATDYESYDYERMPHYFPNPEANDDGDLKAKYPYQIISFRNNTRLHTRQIMDTFAHDVMNEPLLYINQVDADTIGCKNGDYVDCVNDRGHCVMKAVIHNGMRPGLVCYPKGFTRMETKSGSQSSFTTDYYDAWAINCSFFDNRVAIKVWDGKDY
jgi:molybdopterin-containing oxidoreductase family molybdopterin binding subunit